MDITEVTLVGLSAEMLDEQDLRRRFLRYGLISSFKVSPDKHDATVKFVSPISANRAYHEEKQTFEGLGVSVVYDKRESPQPEPTLVETELAAERVYKPYTYQRAKERQAQQQRPYQQLLKDRKNIAVVILAAILLFVALRVMVYLPIKNRLFPVRQKPRRSKPTTKSTKPKAPPSRKK